MAKNYPIFSSTRPSDLFISIVCNEGSVAQDCCCGRTNYDGSGENMDEGELEDLDEKASKNPDQYCAQDGQVHYGIFFGKRIVLNCPCGIMAFYEKKVRGSADKILEYLLERSRIKLARAKEFEELAKEAHAVHFND